MKSSFWIYVENNTVLLGILLVVLVMACSFWCLYKKAARREKQTLQSVKKEKEFYQCLSAAEESCYAYLREKDLQILFLSDNFESMTGIKRDAILTDCTRIEKIFDRKVFRDLKEDIKKWDKSEAFVKEVPYYKVDGSELRQAHIRIERQGEKHSCLVVFRDITEEYEVRQQIRSDLKQAQKESQQKTNFLSQMSHEIRTPMNGILGMLSLAKMHLQDTELAEEYLDKTENLSQFLLQLINDILDMSRIESGKLQLEQAPFDLMQFAQKLDDMFRGTAEVKGIHWSVEMKDFQVRYVIGDEMRLSQVIINFISNATKFTPAGGSVKVVFHLMDVLDHNLHFMIRVKDTGKGIREDFIDKIFRPFEQEDASTASNYGGSGLGMAIADNIVRLMGGQILVDSQEGKGSEFSAYLTLPIAQEYEAQREAQQNQSEGSGAGKEAVSAEALEAFQMDGLRVLMAEDNDINAEITMEILEMQGVMIERARDGEEAVKMFEESETGRYDVILMDIQMPNMDGWEATTKIRALAREDADIPIFAMSANAFIEDQRHSMEVGMNGHINKPVDYEEMRRAIGACLIGRGTV